MVIFVVKFFYAANLLITWLMWHAVSRWVLQCVMSSVYCLLHPEEASWRNVDVMKRLFPVGVELIYKL